MSRFFFIDLECFLSHNGRTSHLTLPVRIVLCQCASRSGVVCIRFFNSWYDQGY